MKKYKLKKDLPTYEVGREAIIRDGGLYMIEPQSPDGIILLYSDLMLNKHPSILTNWFEEVPEQPKTVWDLKEGDICYYLTAMGIIQETTFNDLAPRDCLTVGSLFLTKEEAEKELARRKAKQVLLRDTKGFKPDWNGDSQNYEVYYDYFDKKLDSISYSTGLSHKDLWFKSEEDAEASIKAHEKEWKIYLGVEE